MVERKLYKTKLCVLYQKGHCHRQSCSFAHGNAELRGSFNGRRDYRTGDLRNRLDRRRHSPQHRHSPGRDAQGRHVPHGDSPGTRERMRKRRKNQQFDGHSDFSGSLRMSEGTEDKIRDLRQATSDSKDFLKEELRKTQTEVKILDDHKRELENYLQEMTLEANNITSRIQELEMQLSQEKEEYDRLTSKIKKFMKAYNRQMDLEDELKRSRSRVQKLGEQLSLDFSRPDATEEDLNINNRTIGESAGNHASPKYDLQNLASPSKKRGRVHLEADVLSNQVNPTKDQEPAMGNVRLEKLSRWNARSNSRKNVDARELSRSSADEYKLRKPKNSSTNASKFDKSKVSELGLVLPSTSMAAHAMDEVVDIVETEEKVDGTGTVMETEKEGAFKIPPLPFPPPPPPLPAPIPQNAYAEYKGADENVDIDGIEEETLEVDIV